MEDFLNHLLGEGVVLSALSAWLIWAYIAFAVSVYMDYMSSGEKLSRIDWPYFWNDNRDRIILSVIIIPIALIFSEELLGGPLTRQTALMSGFTIDKVIETIKNRRKRKAIKAE